MHVKIPTLQNRKGGAPKVQKLRQRLGHPPDRMMRVLKLYWARIIKVTIVETTNDATETNQNADIGGWYVSFDVSGGTSYVKLKVKHTATISV